MSLSVTKVWSDIVGHVNKVEFVSGFHDSPKERDQRWPSERLRMRRALSGARTPLVTVMAKLKVDFDLFSFSRMVS